MIDMKHEEREQQDGPEPYGLVLARLTKCRMRCARLEAIIGDMIVAAAGVQTKGEMVLR